ncbi:MAG: HD-GYP domain-containing protein [Treponema sp.]|nr:HD-GYP domain-containing protein [Treponema sp.]
MGNLETVNLTLDAVAIIFSLILAVSVIVNRSSDKRVKIFFNLMIFFNILMTVCDMSDWICRGTTDFGNYLFVSIGSAFYFIAMSGLTVALYFYEKNYLRDRVTFEPIFAKICISFFILQSILALLSIKIDLYFSISELNEYIRGPLYPVANILPAIVAFTVIYTTLKHKEELRFRELILFLCYAVLPLAAGGIQAAFRGIGIMNIFITISITLCYVNMESDYLNNISREQSHRLSQALVNSIEAKYFYTDDHLYTKGHSIRVANYAREIASHMNFNLRELENIYYIALLHDVGKVGIPDYIINKKDKLTEEEYARIKEHTVIGARILRDIPLFADAARHHHEWYDGSGYPDKLKGEEIPLYSRIIAVADSYDAMSSSRIYRNTMPQNEIYNEIKEGRGTQFDPEIADIMLEMIEDDTDFLMQQML